jgi:glucokinase
MVVGIDIGGTRVKAAVVSGSGETIRTAQAPTEVGLERFEQSISAMLRGLLDGLPAVSAAGIGCKGIIDSLTTEVLTLPGAMHYLEGRRLGDIIRTVLPEGCPVIADNDARIAMAGDLLFDLLRKDVHERTMPLLRRAVPIVKSELADPSGTLGAAALALTLEAQ